MSNQAPIKIRPINTEQPKQVPEGAQFFCLIGKETRVLSPHTFFHCGFVDDSGQAHTLVEVGKLGDGGLRYGDNGCGILSNILFGESGGIIVSEKHQIQKYCYPDRQFPISYAAFAITEAQYLDFLGVLKQVGQYQQEYKNGLVDAHIAKEIANGRFALADEAAILERKARLLDSVNPIYRKGIFAFQPVDAEGNYQYQDIMAWNKQQSPAAVPPSADNASSGYNTGDAEMQSFHNLSLGNTCRHSGVRLLDILLGGDSEAYQQSVSNSFLKSMPCRTTLSSGGYIGGPLYILPHPPTAYDQLAPDQQQILYKLYHRMEGISNGHHDKPSTRAKFELLNKLYQGLVEDQEPSSLNFLQTIVVYRSGDLVNNFINQHRGWHWPFFHQTRTAEMFDTFERQLAQIEDKTNESVETSIGNNIL